MFLLHPFELMAVGVIAFYLLRFRLAQRHQQPWLTSNRQRPTSDTIENLLILLAFLLATASK